MLAATGTRDVRPATSHARSTGFSFRRRETCSKSRVWPG
jgi:hypothetical protein